MASEGKGEERSDASDAKTAESSSGYTPHVTQGRALHAALRRGDVAEVRRLLQLTGALATAEGSGGGDGGGKAGDGSSSTRPGLGRDVVRARLLELLHWRSPGGATALHVVARQQGDAGAACAALLVAAAIGAGGGIFGSLMQLTDKARHPPLCVACAVGALGVVKELCKLARVHCVVDCRGLMGRTAVHHAVVARRVDCLKVLADSGANLCALNASDDMPIHDAAAYGSMACVQLLIELVPETLLTRNKLGQTPLHIAMANGHASIGAALLSAVGRAKPGLLDAEDLKGATPLHYAAQRRFPECVTLLTANGANPNACDHDGRTPLFGAALRATGADIRYACAARLVTVGADPSVVDEQGRTAEEIITDKEAAYGSVLATTPHMFIRACQVGRVYRDRRYAIVLRRHGPYREPSLGNRKLRILQRLPQPVFEQMLTML